MKQRLDQLLHSRGLADSRSQAQALILAGEVTVSGQRVDKPGQKVPVEATIEVREKPPFVSRAGGKLAGALDHFGVSPAGKTCLDVGASTGGFTDCLLQRGAAKVYAFDVGTNQLVWKLREDPRVISREQFNCRNLTPNDLGEPINLGVTDVSFISLTLILPPMLRCLGPGGQILALIKPQFEAPREAIGKGGIVRDEAVRQACVSKIRQCIEAHGARWLGVIDSAVIGSDGNRELVAFFEETRLQDTRHKMIGSQDAG